MLKIIKELLLKIVDDIDAGNSNIREEDAINLVSTLKEFVRKDAGISKYSACVYLGISRATFDRYVSEGKLPKGKHEIGFKELRWYKKDLDKYIKKMRNEL